MISTLDTHRVVKELKAAGFTDEQAEAVTRAVQRAQEIDLSDLVTKADFTALKTDLVALKTDLHLFETKLTAEVRTFIAEPRAELIKWVVGIAFAQVATIVAILKLFPAAHP